MVVLDGESLASGETRILTDVGEITTGDGTRLRIRPGGGSSLSEARALATSSRGLFSETLARHTLRDLDRFKRVHLTLDGSRDPQAELSHALARREAARELSVSEQCRFAAIAKLHQLFVDSRTTLDHNLARPLSDRISGYLQCVFDVGTEVRLDLSDTGIGGIELVRAGDPAFGFSSLSGGGREQVAAAVRLAMAEILATDQDGCLQILFDDAFAIRTRRASARSSARWTAPPSGVSRSSPAPRTTIPPSELHPYRCPELPFFRHLFKKDCLDRETKASRTLHEPAFYRVPHPPSFLNNTAKQNVTAQVVLTS